VGPGLLRLSGWDCQECCAMVRSGAHRMTRPTSYAPIVLAAGAMLTLWGATSTWLVSVAGLLVIGIGTARWIKDLRNEH
jgi:hypothetical protein